jgi:NADH-quinone oxidoreductase subunit N
MVNAMTDPAVLQTLKGVFRLAAPEIALIGTACVVLLLGCFYNRRWLWFLVSLIGVGLSAILAGALKTTMPEAMTSAPLIPDTAATFVRWVAIISAALFLLVSWPEVDRTNAAEYYACLLVAAAGVSLVGRANDLITLFLALELLSIPTYVLLYLPARSRKSQEAAAKYFLLSVMSSAVLLFGFSYLYGATGTTNITAIVGTLTAGNAERASPLTLVAAVMVVAAVGFRITAVPFHFYAPDVYEGGPAGVVAQLAFWPKVAGFVALARVFGLIAADRHLPFEPGTPVPALLWLLAVATMSVGNVLAVLQDDIRRMLAYSSVAHAGYMLMGVIVAGSFAGTEVNGEPGSGGMDAVLFYLVAYGAMTVGAFAVVVFLSTPERPVESIDDLAGLGETHPVTAASMGVFLLSLIGIPLTAGFVGKLLLFVGSFGAPAGTPAMGNLNRLLVVVAAVNAAVGAYYYLRVLGVMYLRSPLRPKTDSRAWPTAVAAVLLAAFTVVFGVYPDPLVKACRNAAPPPRPASIATP